MCDPTALAIGSLVIGAVGKIGQAKAQDKASTDNRNAALASLTQSSADISFQEAQRTAAAGLTIQQTDRAARATKALAQVAAGAAGVGGISVEALMGDIDSKAATSKLITQENLDNAIGQLQRERVANNDVAQARIKGVPASNPLATGISILGDGLGFWAGRIGRTPPSLGNPGLGGTGNTDQEPM